MQATLQTIVQANNQVTNEFNQMSQDFDKVKEVSKKTTECLDSKIDISDIKRLEKELEKFPLYADFKNLYDKVVPPLVETQDQMQRCVDKIA